jgi:hypothetical protein
LPDSIINDKDIINDKELEKIIKENDISSYNVSEEELLQTEVNICENCMHPNIIGREKFNRRTKEVKHIKLDTVVNAAFTHFLKLHRLDSNAGIAYLLMNNKEGTILTDIPKRKGRKFRSNKIMDSISEG